MPANDVTNAERDLAVRTMLGEASGQGDAGLAGVGHVIMNRVQSGRYGGGNVADVVLAKNQFEPWSTRKDELLAISPKDPKYQRAQAIFDQIVSGEMPDITDGSTHFLNAKVVRDRGNYGGGLPKWTAGGGQDIGDHTFYKPDGAVRRVAPIVRVPSERATASWDDVLGDAGRNATAGGPAPQPKAAPSNEDLWGEITKGAEANVRESAPQEAAAGVRDRKTGELMVGGKPFTDNSAGMWNGLVNFATSAVPVLGQPIQAATAAAKETLLGSGGSFTDNYRQANSVLNAARDGYAAENPLTSLATGVAGGAVGLAPVLATGPGAAMLGAGPGTLASRGVLGAISGGTLGAADTGARGKGGEEAAKALGFGLAGGAAAPYAGKAIGAGASALINAIGDRVVPVAPGLSGPSGRVLNGLVSSDGVQAVRNRLMELGGDGMLAEAGPSLEGAAAGLIPKPGDAKSILVNAVRERATGANARLNDDVRAGIGPAEDPTKVTAEILALRKARDAENYQKALGEAPAVDVSGLVKTIDGALKTAEGSQKTALQTLRGRLVKGEAEAAVPGGPTGLLDATGAPIMGGGKAATAAKLQTSAENLHNIKGELDAVINHAAPGLGVEAASVARTQGALKMARGKLNAALEEQVPGYADANRASAALAKRAEAVETGTGVLGSGKTTLTPDGLAETLNGMSPGERIALAKGTRGEIERQLGVKVNDLTALKQALQGEGGWNTAKLEQIFGKEGTGRLVSAVAREAAFADTTNKLLQNSQTANRLGGAAFIKDKAGEGMDLRGTTLTGLAAHYGKKIAIDPVVNLLTKTDNSGRDAEIARVLSARGPERDRLVAALTSRAVRLEGTNRLAEFLASRAGAGANALTLAAGPAYARSR